MDGTSGKGSGQQVENLLSLVMASVNNAYPNAWDIAADAIASITDNSLMLEFCTAAQFALTERWKPLTEQAPSLTSNQEEDYLEVVIQGVGNAEQITPVLRLNLLLALSVYCDRRLTKGAMIDALEILIGDVDDDSVIAVARAAIARYTDDSDPYIEDYAMDALKNSRHYVSVK